MKRIGVFGKVIIYIMIRLTTTSEGLQNEEATQINEEKIHLQSPQSKYKSLKPPNSNNIPNGIT